MKNTLLTTTAIALTGFAGTASAVEVAVGAVNLDIGGFFRTTAAISNVDAAAGTDYDGIDILTNSEIHFKPSITLDNGIKIGVDIELEGNQDNDQIDESTIFAQGGFGKVELGSKDSAGKNMQVGAPDASMVYANSTSLTAFVPFYSASYPTTYQQFEGDSDRITYYSPDFSGFKVGFSYARNASQTNGPVNNNDENQRRHIVDVGATYGGTVGGVDLGLSARYGTYDHTATFAVVAVEAVAEVVDDTTGEVTTEAVQAVAVGDVIAGDNNPTVTGVGLKLGFGDVSVGGGYVEIDLDTPSVANSEFYDIGVSFANGPMSYSLVLVNGNVAASESRVIVAAATYSVNSHFKVGVSISDVERDVIADTDDDVDAQVVALSAQFSF